jgi:hypothetical protein
MKQRLPFVLLGSLTVGAGCAHPVARHGVPIAAWPPVATSTPVIGDPTSPSIESSHQPGPFRCVVPAAPIFPDNDKALAAAPGLIGQDELRKAGREARAAYQRAVIAAVRACNHD